MNLAVETLLRTIGAQVDEGIYPTAFNDGVLAPRGLVVDLETLGAENGNEQFGTCGSAAGSWQGAAGWQGSSGEPGAPDQAESSGSWRLRKNYLGQLSAVREAYPRSKYWLCDNGMWLWVEGAVLAGLDRRVTFLISVPFCSPQPIRSWAFWVNALSYRWIGPRHTNAIDGSICAFNPSDGTWKIGGDLVELIDQYTMWAFCHLHHETLGWWPGKQTAEYAYERLTELNDNEWCGCGPDAKRYRSCCMQSDLKADRFQAAMEFVGGFLKFQRRYPPHNVLEFLRMRRSPPQFQTKEQNPSLLIGSCLRPAKIGASLSVAAMGAMPRP